MNIQNYKDAMNELSPDKQKLYTRIQEKVSDRSVKYLFKGPRPALAFALALCLLAGCLLIPALPGQEKSLTIMACAAGSKSIPLSEEPTFVYCQSDIQFAVTHADSDHGVVNYNLGFQCEGDGILQITYRCQDEPVTPNNRADASCYFVYNLTVPVEEKESYMKREDFLQSLQPSGSPDCEMVFLIGNEYTVPYDRQDTEIFGIEIPVTTTLHLDDTASITYETAAMEPITIEVILTMEDGSTQTKELRLTPAENDAMDGLNIQLLP